MAKSKPLQNPARFRRPRLVLPGTYWFVMNGPAVEADDVVGRFDSLSGAVINASKVTVDYGTQHYVFEVAFDGKVWSDHRLVWPIPPEAA